MPKTPILDYFIKRGIINANPCDGGLEIMEKSLPIIEAGLKEIAFRTSYDELNKNTDSNGKQKITTKIGDYYIFHKYNWDSFGDGVWRDYHDDILKNVNTVSRLRKSKNNIKFEYSNLPQEKNIETDLNNMFRKKLPNYISKNLFEAKNYIVNRWFVLESVNFFNAALGLCPDIDELTSICLSSHRAKLIPAKIIDSKRLSKLLDKEELRRMRESEIRGDITKFREAGVIGIQKSGKKEFYGVSSLKFNDKKNTFALMEPDKVKKEYENKNYAAFLR